MATSTKYRVTFTSDLDTTIVKRKIKEISSTPINIKTVGGQNVDKLNKSLTTTGQRFTEIIGKVAKFGAATAVIGAFTSAVAGSVKVVTEFDKTLTEFKKVSDLSGDSLKAYTKQLGELGSAVARTRTEMLDAATQFKKTGFTEDDSSQLAYVASLFQNIADSELSAGDAASFITSQIKAFNLQASDAEIIIDKINEVSNNFSVSSTDISLALRKTSSAMSVLGNDLNETIGLVTAGTELMTGQASKVSRGLRTIGNNFASAAKESKSFDIKVQGTTKTISLLDKKTGDIKSTFGIFQDISKYWNDMTNAEKQSVAITYAGKMILARTGLIAGKVQKHFCLYSGNLKTLILNYNSNIVTA